MSQHWDSRPSTPGPTTNFAAFVVDGQLQKRVRELEKEVATLRGEKYRQQFIDRDFPANDASLGSYQDASDDARTGRGHQSPRMAGIVAMKKEFKDHNLWPTRSVKTIKGWGGAGLIKKLKSGQKISWRRAHELIGEDLEHPHLFYHTLAPSDVIQGDLGNCWFTSAVAAVAEFPSLIRNLFLTHEYNKEGKYVVKICKDGLWKEVAVDDFFPASLDGRSPLYMKCRDGGELWPMVLEKAFAKCHGTYRALKAGYPHEALMDLTGFPFDYIKLDYRDEAVLFQQLHGYSVRGYLMAASCRHSEQGTQIGLATGHSYSILKVVEAEGNKLLKIRNPWGHFTWSGAWATTDSERWTDSMARHVAFRPQEAEDGCFWICWDDFRQYFKKIAVSMYQLEWSEHRAQGEWRMSSVDGPGARAGAGLAPCFTVTADRDCHAFLGLRQKDPRSIGSPSVLPAGIDVHDAGEGGGPVLPLAEENEVYERKGWCTPSRQNQVEVSLVAGRPYSVYLYTGLGALAAGERRPFVLSVHGENGDINVEEPEEGAQSASQHREAMHARALASPYSVSTLVVSEDEASGGGDEHGHGGKADGHGGGGKGKGHRQPHVAPVAKKGVQLVELTERCRKILVAKNETAIPARVTLDCSKSTCTSSLLGPLACTVDLPPNGTTLLNVLLREKVWGEAKFECKAEWVSEE